MKVHPASIPTNSRMAHSRYPSISLLRSLRRSCEPFTELSSYRTGAPARPNPRPAVRSFHQGNRRCHVSKISMTSGHPQLCVYRRGTPHQVLLHATNCRQFSTTMSLQAFKTVEQAKSRTNLGVLQISPGQALFRGTSAQCTNALYSH